MTLLAANDNMPPAQPQNPFELLARAGYDAFHADTLEKQNSIKKYFKQGELLCTFNYPARYQDYHIVNAVKKNASQIKREDFKGKETRQDAYGTSVISIQMHKSGGFISIKNRYNHTVSGCDNTFESNPDNIIPGLSSALQAQFNVDFSPRKSSLPEGVTLVGAQKQIFKYHERRDNIYYGDQAWIRGDEIYIVDKSAGDALFDGFLFDNKSKILKKIDPDSRDSFAEDFNKAYGGNRALAVQGGNLLLDGETLIGAEASRIKTLHLPELTSMSNHCLSDVDALTLFTAPALTSMGNCCLYSVPALIQFTAPALTSMGSFCIFFASALKQFTAPALTSIGNCLFYAEALTQFTAPALAEIPPRICRTLKQNQKRPAERRVPGQLL